MRNSHHRLRIGDGKIVMPAICASRSGMGAVTIMSLEITAMARESSRMLAEPRVGRDHQFLRHYFSCICSNRYRAVRVKA